MKRYALVTGASRGVGRAIATALSRKNFTLLLVGRDTETLADTHASLSGTGHQSLVSDLSIEAHLDRLVKQVGEITGNSGLSAYVHCAATTPDPDVETTLADTSDETFNSHLATTAASGVLLLKAVKPMLKTARHSNAILMSSDWVVEGSPGPVVFSAAKAFSTTAWRASRTEYLRIGCVLSVIVAGDIASYDADWAEPKWRLDDPIEDVAHELGQTRVPLLAIANSVEFILNSPLSGVFEVKIAPLDPDYTP